MLGLKRRQMKALSQSSMRYSCCQERDFGVVQAAIFTNKEPEDWPWSSYPLVMNDKIAPGWFDTDGLLGQFGTQRAAARRSFKKFVREGVGLVSPLLATKHQLRLGDADFVRQHQPTLQEGGLRELSIAHKCSMALRLEDHAGQNENRNAAMAQAYHSGAYTMAEIVDYFSVHYMTVSRAVRCGNLILEMLEC